MCDGTVCEVGAVGGGEAGSECYIAEVDVGGGRSGREGGVVWVVQGEVGVVSVVVVVVAVAGLVGGVWLGATASVSEAVWLEGWMRRS